MYRSLFLTIILTTTLSMSPSVLSQGSTAADQTPTPETAQKTPWPASENLQITMTEVVSLLRGAGADMSDKQPTEAQLDALADGLEQLVARISVDDTTEIRAKKALKLITGEFGDSVDLMRNASHLAARRLGYLMAVRTANNYGKEFDHAGWVPVGE